MLFTAQLVQVTKKSCWLMNRCSTDTRIHHNDNVGTEISYSSLMLVIMVLIMHKLRIVS